jgi:hypothetical protein
LSIKAFFVFVDAEAGGGGGGELELELELELPPKNVMSTRIQISQIHKSNKKTSSFP